MKNVRRYLKEYCDLSSIHGFPYFVEEKRTVFERIWWIIAFTTSVSACGFSIYQVYNKWEQSPVVITFANTETPIYNIPFPAVTICPEARTDTTTFSFSGIMQQLREKKQPPTLELVKYFFLMLTCHHAPTLTFPLNLTFGEEFLHYISAARPAFSVERCFYFAEGLNCSVLFPVLTDEGLCYSFNMIHEDVIFKEETRHPLSIHLTQKPTSDWTIQKGYSHPTRPTMYPQRAFMAGAKNGLKFHIVTPHKNNDILCKDSVQGYRITIDNPMNIPIPGQKFFRVPFDKSVAAVVKPTMVTTSNKVQDYDVERRQCYFENERPLKYFKKYTASNCKLECATNMTIAACGCVNYFMPRTNETNICNTNHRQCMKKAEDQALISDMLTRVKMQNFSGSCNCLPTCSDLTYAVQTTTTSWDWQEDSTNSSDKSYKASVTIYFKTDAITTLERNELYSPIDFLAYVGGLLGLFTGFSVLSLMEIIYFFTVRIIANKLKYGLWAGPEN